MAIYSENKRRFHFLHYSARRLCKKIGLTAEQTVLLLTGKALNFSGSLYSDEHRKKFIVENAEIKVFSTSAKPNQYQLVQGAMGQLEKQNLYKGEESRVYN